MMYHRSVRCISLYIGSSKNIYIYIFKCIYIYEYTSTYTCTCTCTRACHVHVHVQIHIHIHIHTHFHIHIHFQMHDHLHLHLHVPKEVSKSNFRQYRQMEKQRWKESERRSQEVRISEKRKSEKKEDAGARKGRKVAIHCILPMIWGSGGSKSRLAKAAGAEPSRKMRDKKLHAVVARSTFGSSKAKNTSRSDHSWKLRRQKSARHCGAKHISKSKCTKHAMFGPFLEVEMSKKCTPLWREAHFQVKMYKTRGVRTAFDVQRSKKRTPLWREAHFQVKSVKN